MQQTELVQILNQASLNSAIVRARPTAVGLSGTRAVYAPTPLDKEIAEIVIGNLFGQVSEWEPLERTQNVILVDVSPYISNRGASDDPVIPLVLTKTSWLYRFCLRQFTLTVARYNAAKRRNWIPNPAAFDRLARFWARLLVALVPLDGAERLYFVYQIYKTVNNPERKQ